MANPGQTPSFKTDVTRNPTKRWVNAPSYSYDGDDWDNYDDYDTSTYNQAPKPTGLRQKGQAINTTTDPPRSFTNPEAVNTAAVARDPRSSVEGGDERRVFSTGAPSRQPPSLDMSTINPGIAAGSRFSDSPRTIPANTDSSAQQQMRRPGNTSSYPPRVAPKQLQTNMAPSYSGSQEQGSAGGAPVELDTSPSNYSTTTASSAAFSPRDYPTSSLPPTQAEIYSISNAESTSTASRFPPRKSSINQSTNPAEQVLAELEAPGQERSQGTRGLDGTAEQPQAEPAPTPRAFIRPADIYKRIEEEREKERRSSDSSRPSMDSSTERNRASGTAQRSSNSPMRSVITAADAQAGVSTQSGDSHQSTNPAVSESTTSTTLTGFSVNDPALARAIGANVGGSSVPATNRSESTENTTSVSEPPKLPNLLRFSGFGLGTDIWGSSGSSAPTNRNTSQPEGTTSSGTADPTLQHQPSLGFRSAVDQAFDESNDRLAPLTPSSAYGSQRSVEGSDISARGTNSTGGISPIMSRVPSGATAAAFAVSQRDATIGSTPVIHEDDQENVSGSRPGSSSTLRGPSQVLRKATPSHSRNVSADSTTSSITPGYRRRTSPPNTKNSPARSAAIQVSQEIQEGTSGQFSSISEEGDYSSPQHPSDYASREADLAAAVNSNPKDEEASAIPSTESEVDQDHPTRGRGIVSDKNTEAAPDATTESRRSSLSSWASSKHRSLSPQKRETNVDDNTKDALNAPSNATPTITTEDVDQGGQPLDAFAAVTAAGSAVAASVLASVGLMGQSSHDTTESAEKSVDDQQRPAPRQNLSFGDIYVRPLVQGTEPSSAGSSVPPAPPSKDTPNRSVSDNAVGYFPKSPSVEDEDASDADLESDKLRHDIMRSLTPKDSNSPAVLANSAFGPPSPSSPSFAHAEGRNSTVLPSEYDSYWAVDQSPDETNDNSDAQHAYAPLPAIQDENEDEEPTASENVSVPAPRQLADSVPSSHVPPARLDRKFSWEQDEDEDERNLVPMNQSDPNAEAAQHIVSPLEEGNSRPMFAEAPTEYAELDANQSQHLGAGDRLAERSMAAGPSVSPVAYELEGAGNGSVSSMSQLHTPQDQPRTSTDRAEGLNTSSIIGSGPAAAPVSPVTPKSPAPNTTLYQSRPVGFKEIVSIKQTGDRIRTYNSTREHFATTDTGLSSWLAFMASQNPAYVTSTPGQSPLPSAGLGVTGAKRGSPMQQPYYQRYLDSAAQVPSPTGTGATSTSSQGPMRAATTGGRATSGQMSAKGKDLLHSAGVFSGKATTGAKGLFAKGKSKLRAASGSEKARTRSANVQRTAEAPPASSPEKMPSSQVPTAQRIQPEETQHSRSTAATHLQPPSSESRPRSLIVINPDVSPMVSPESPPIAIEQPANRAETLAEPSELKPANDELNPTPAFLNSPRESFSSAVSTQQVENSDDVGAQAQSTFVDGQNHRDIGASESQGTKPGWLEELSDPAPAALNSTFANSETVTRHPVSSIVGQGNDLKPLAAVTDANADREMLPLDPTFIHPAFRHEFDVTERHMSAKQDSSTVPSSASAVTGSIFARESLVPVARETPTSAGTVQALSSSTAPTSLQPLSTQSAESQAPETGLQQTAPQRLSSLPIPVRSINANSNQLHEGQRQVQTDMQQSALPSNSARTVDPVDPRRQGTEYSVPGIGPPLQESTKSKSWPRFRPGKPNVADNGQLEARQSRVMQDSNLHAEPLPIEEPAVPLSENNPRTVEEQLSPRPSTVSPLPSDIRRQSAALPVRSQYPPSHSMSPPTGATARPVSEAVPRTGRNVRRSSSPEKKKRFSGVGIGGFFGRSETVTTPPSKSNKLTKTDTFRATDQSRSSSQKRGRRSTTGGESTTPAPSSRSRPRSVHPLDHPHSKYQAPGLVPQLTMPVTTSDGRNVLDFYRPQVSEDQQMYSPQAVRPPRDPVMDAKRRSHIEYLQSHQIFPTRPQAAPQPPLPAPLPRQTSWSARDDRTLTQSPSAATNPSRLSDGPHTAFRDTGKRPYVRQHSQEQPQQQYYTHPPPQHPPQSYYAPQPPLPPLPPQPQPTRSPPPDSPRSTPFRETDVFQYLQTRKQDAQPPPPSNTTVAPAALSPTREALDLPPSVANAPGRVAPPEERAQPAPAGLARRGTRGLTKQQVVEGMMDDDGED